MTFSIPAPDAIGAFLAAVKFNSEGLVAVVAQQHDTGEVLMQAWMNEEALRQTLAGGQMVYWSRSRQSLWRKGETSGQQQMVQDLRLDCDGDSILALVDQTGVACHTGRRSCYFMALRDGKMTSISDVIISEDRLYGG